MKNLGGNFLDILSQFEILIFPSHSSQVCLRHIADVCEFRELFERFTNRLICS
jgi:hypothetical protein